MRTRRPGVLVIAALAVAALAGCSTPSGPPVPTTPIEPDPAVTDETPPPATADPEDPATWRIDGAGIGPVLLGDDFAETLDELPDSWNNDEQCSQVAFWNAPDGSYMAAFSRDAVDDTAPIDLVSVSAPADAVTAAGPVTEEDLGIGATKDQVRAAYPHADEGEAAIGDGSTWMRIAFEGGAAIFFQYAPDAEEAFGVVVTTLLEPSYEQCG